MKEWIKQLRAPGERASYEGGVSMREASKMVGIGGAGDIIPLQSNENLFVSREFILYLVRTALGRIDPRLYPHEEADELRESIGRYMGLSPREVFLGAGTDQIIDLLASLFRNDGAVGIVEPTFSMYRVRFALHGAKIISLSYGNDFSLPVDGILKEDIGLLFLCSPNNPTGNSIRKGELEQLLDSFRGLIVMDETYAEISAGGYAEYLKRFDNIAIMRTFSKSFALAGMRVGYMVGPANLIAALNGAQLTFPISGLSLAVATEALKHLDYFKGKWNEALKTTKWFLGRLDQGVMRTPTDTFFLTISTQASAEELFTKLLRKGYLTRKLAPFPGYMHPLRLSMAPRHMIASLPDLISEAGRRPK